MDAVVIFPYPDWNGHSVLVAEDHDDNFMVLAALLKRTHLKLYRANNGIEVLQQLDAHPEISVILMDISLPEMDGIESLGLVRQKYPKKVVIAQTAHSFSEKIQEAGFDAFIRKPILRSKLIEILQPYLAPCSSN